MLRMRPRSLAAIAAAMVLLAGCHQASPQNNVANEAKPVPTATLPPFPLPQPPLDREHLLIAALQAASDFAGGVAAGTRQSDLADKKFEFHIRFGCNGPGDEHSKLFGWSFDDKTRALRVHAKPDLSKKDEPVAAVADPSFEAVEGFWVQQPWLLEAACPAKPQPEAQAEPTNAKSGTTKAKPAEKQQAAAPTPQPLNESVGIAQFYTAADPRTARRGGRPYEATKRLEEGDQPTGGFDLVLSGRLKALPDGRVIACTASADGGRPACVISVEFGKVWIERADTHEVLAQWGAG